MDSSAKASESTEAQSAVRPRIRTIAAVVNESAGSVGAGAAARLEAIVADHGLPLILFNPPPADLERSIRSAVDGAPDLLLVLGGDGTARMAAECCGPDGPLLATLPGGTLNMLPHILYGGVSWTVALKAALEQGVTRDISGGLVDGRGFYVAAVLGSPALWGAAREAVRSGKLRQAWRRAIYALRRAFSGRIHYRLAGMSSHEAEALVLINPMVSKVSGEALGLEVAELGMRNAREMFRLAFNGLVGDWRNDPGATVYTSLQGRVRASRPIPCILDGEGLLLRRQAEFAFVPRAFRALALPGIRDGVL